MPAFSALVVKVVTYSRSYRNGKPLEGLHERTEHLDIFLFFHPSFNCVVFRMFYLLVEGECQILVF